MLTGSLIALCRKLPLHLWHFILRRVSIVVDISNDDPLFAWLSLWLAQHPYSQRARSLTATSERDEHGRATLTPDAATNELPQILMTPAPGNHLLWYRRRLVWLSRERKDAAPAKDDSLGSLWKREVFTLRVIGRDQAAAKGLLEEARVCAQNRRQRKIEVFSASYDYWQRIDERDLRPLSSVFLPEGVSEDIVSDVSRFLSSQSWYAERGIRWGRNYLLYGVPRSGKTSLICALAGSFRMNLYLLNLGGPYLTDDTLMALLSKVPSRSFVLLEDIDAAFNQRDKSDDVRNKLTFSGLLNALDGAGTKAGTLVFITTNHIDRLDPALIGAGRVDYRQEFTFATADQANRMFCSYFPDAEGADGFGDRVAQINMSMADVQNYLIQYRDSYLHALNNINTDKAA
jgi:chaperone BCS1